ncbi:MAG TPA: DUF1573 domain-containing protein [Luteibaculaceae bacterium]|nr:DUF1573 domain-containing protein [Luteibaculaceae bacterium]
MKKLIFLSMLALAMTACKSEGQDGEITTDIIKNPATVDPDELPVITFKEERIDFGTIQEGDKVTKTFEFENTGKSELVLSGVSAACGCTVPNNWPRQPIAPGETGRIEVTFNSQGKPGQQVKQIVVTANTNPANTTIALAGFVTKTPIN